VCTHPQQTFSVKTSVSRKCHQSNFILDQPRISLFLGIGSSPTCQIMLQLSTCWASSGSHSSTSGPELTTSSSTTRMKFLTKNVYLWCYLLLLKFTHLPLRPVFLNGFLRLRGKLAPSNGGIRLSWCLCASWRLRVKLAPSRLLKNCPLELFKSGVLCVPTFY
jgi:hypothetical protein